MKPSLKTSLITTNLLAAALLSSCSGPSIQGLPKNLPVINLHGNKNTPPHTMAKNEYPFDEDGTYRSEWVAAGGGRSAAESDNTSWRTSHGGAPTPDKDYTPPKKRKFSTSKSKIKGGSYTIKQGDSLSAIAKRNGTTVAKLKAANGLKSDLIRAGKTLKIPR
jgi:hypothetical protein